MYSNIADGRFVIIPCKPMWESIHPRMKKIKIFFFLFFVYSKIENWRFAYILCELILETIYPHIKKLKKLIILIFYGF